MGLGTPPLSPSPQAGLHPGFIQAHMDGSHAKAPPHPTPSLSPLPYLVASKILSLTTAAVYCRLIGGGHLLASLPLLAGSILTPLWLLLRFTAEGTGPCTLQVILPLPTPPSLGPPWVHFGALLAPPWHLGCVSPFGPHKPLVPSPLSIPAALCGGTLSPCGFRDPSSLCSGLAWTDTRTPLVKALDRRIGHC